MRADNRSANVLRIPLSVNYNGVDYQGEVVGNVSPVSKYFTCNFHNANLFILEAVYDKFSRTWDWISRSDHEFSYLSPSIGKEVEKYFNK